MQKITMAWLAENAPKIHAANVAKGFYDQHPPMAERLRSVDFLIRISNLISSELFEFYEAYRVGKIKQTDFILHSIQPVPLDLFKVWYEQKVKGFAAEELADVVIRCTDFLGSINVKITKSELFTTNISLWSVDEYCYQMRQSLGFALKKEKKYIVNNILSIIAMAQQAADLLQIDLMLEIELKLKYNLSRAYKHGKNF